MTSRLTRFRVVPVDLYRLQTGWNVKLREFHAQKAKQKASFDYKQNAEGKIEPTVGDFFKGPNGMSLRPAGPNLTNIATSYNAKNVYRIPEGVEIPENMVLIHEHTDHYSLQTTVVCTEKELNARMTKFLKQHAEEMTMEQFLEKFPAI
jgi:hypothetical protein